MSQTNPEINWDTPGSVALPRLDEVLSAMRSSWSGSMAPPDPQQGQMWVDTSPTGYVTIKVYYTGSWISVYHIYSATDVRLVSQAGTENIANGVANKYPDAAAVKEYSEEHFAGKNLAAVGAAGLVEKATADNLSEGDADKYPDALTIKAFVNSSQGGLIGVPVMFRAGGTYTKNPLATFIIIKMYGKGGDGGDSAFSPPQYISPGVTSRAFRARGGNGAGGEYAQKYMVAANIPSSVLVSFDETNNQVSFGAGAALIFSVKNGGDGTSGRSAAPRRHPTDALNGTNGTPPGTGADASSTTPALRAKSNGIFSSGAGVGGAGGRGSSTSADGEAGDPGLAIIYEYR